MESVELNVVEGLILPAAGLYVFAEPLLELL